MNKRRHLKVFVFASFLVVLPLFYFFTVPDISRLKNENPKKTAYMTHREKEWQMKGKKLKIHQSWVPLSGVSPYLVKAVLIGEDDKFWSHEGFDYEAIEKAIQKNLKMGKFK